MIRMNGYFSTPPVVKNLIIINVLMYMATVMIPNGVGDKIVEHLALYYWQSDNFQPYQVVTHMFLHGGGWHLFTNMFTLWMFGRSIEERMGSSRFLTYYMATGLGAALLHMGVMWGEVAYGTKMVTDPIQLQAIFNSIPPTVGASGAVFGLLLAFGMFYPNNIIMLLFPPIPMKAKYFVMIFGALELFLGVTSTSSGIAHFAHVGGMLFGFLLLRYWKRTGKFYY